MEQMRCAQCGRALSAATVQAGVCPSCGYPIARAVSTASEPAEDGSQTRPMPPALRPAPVTPPMPDAAPTAPPPPPAEALTAPAAPIPSYRPPALPRATSGTAATVPASAAEQTAALPPGLLPGVVTAPSSPSSGETPESKRPGLGWLVALLLLIVLLLGSAAALLAANGQLSWLVGQASPTVTATASPTAGPPPPPTGFTRFTGAGYTIDYPSGWSQTTLPGSTTNFSNLAIQAAFQVQTFDHVSDPLTLDDGLINQLGPALVGSGQGSSAVSGKTDPTSVTVAGTVWTREEADVAVTSGGKTTTWHVVALAVAHQQQSLLVSYYAHNTDFAGQDRASFEPMLSSLLLVSSQP